MSVMEKIFGAFKAGTPPVNPNQQAQVPGQPMPTNNLQTPPHTAPQQTTQTAPNGVVPQGDHQAAPEKKESPLQDFQDLWQPKKPDENANPQQQGQQQIDPAKLMEAASKVDFSKVISAEDMQKIAAGGPDAMNVLVASLNAVAQQSYGRSMVATSKIVEQAVNKAREEFAAEIPTMVKRQSVGERLMGENPAFANPAVRPIVEALKDQLTEKFPLASSAEIEKMAKKYFSEAAGVFAPPKQDPAPGSKGSKGQEPEQDWDTWA